MSSLTFHGAGHHYNKCTDGPDGKRCQECLKAVREVFNRRRDARRAALSMGFITVEHGNVDMYRKWGCRCDDCREAARVERLRYRHGGKPGHKVGETPPKTRKSPTVNVPFREWLNA